MSLNARLSKDDSRLYNVNRDIAHCFGDIMREVAARLEDERWKALADLLKEQGVTMEQLGEACKAYLLFVVSSVDDPKERMSSALSRCGWHDLPEITHIALMAIMGTVITGYFWAGAREVTLDGEGPVNQLQDLREAGREAHRVLTMSRFGRWWHRRMARIRRIIRAFRSE